MTGPRKGPKFGHHIEIEITEKPSGYQVVMVGIHVGAGFLGVEDFQQFVHDALAAKRWLHEHGLKE